MSAPEGPLPESKSYHRIFASGPNLVSGLLDPIDYNVLFLLRKCVRYVWTGVCLSVFICCPVWHIFYDAKNSLRT